MTDTIGKIEQLTEPDDLTIAYMVGFSKGMDVEASSVRKNEDLKKSCNRSV